MAAPGALPEFATDATYSSGTMNGQPNKVDHTSGEKAQGALPDQFVPPRKFNFLTNLICRWIAFLHGKPEFIEYTANAAVDLTSPDWSWVRWIYAEVVGGGGGGADGDASGAGNGAGGGGSGYKATGWLSNVGGTMTITVGAGGAAEASGGLSRVRVGSGTVQTVVALGGQPGESPNGGAGYSGGGAPSEAGGVLGSDGVTSSEGDGGSGIHGAIKAGSGLENPALGGADAGGSLGGGGGGGGHWPGVNGADGATGPALGADGGQGGQGVGGGGGGGGANGGIGIGGPGGAGARGGVRIWKF